jgi:hypothetical protein
MTRVTSCTGSSCTPCRESILFLSSSSPSLPSLRATFLNSSMPFLRPRPDFVRTIQAHQQRSHTGVAHLNSILVLELGLGVRFERSESNDTAHTTTAAVCLNYSVCDRGLQPQLLSSIAIDRDTRPSTSATTAVTARCRLLWRRKLMSHRFVPLTLPNDDRSAST